MSHTWGQSPELPLSAAPEGADPARLQALPHSCTQDRTPLQHSPKSVGTDLPKYEWRSSSPFKARLCCCSQDAKPQCLSSDDIQLDNVFSNKLSAFPGLVLSVFNTWAVKRMFHPPFSSPAAHLRAILGSVCGLSLCGSSSQSGLGWQQQGLRSTLGSFEGGKRPKLLCMSPLGWVVQEKRTKPTWGGSCPAVGSASPGGTP